LSVSQHHDLSAPISQRMVSNLSLRKTAPLYVEKKEHSLRLKASATDTFLLMIVNCKGVLMYHKDKECNQAIIRLLDCLCEWERNTGRGSTLFLIPHFASEPLVIAQDGKPLPEQSDGMKRRIFEIAINKYDSTIDST